VQNASEASILNAAGERFTIPEIVKNTARLSPFEDLMKRTLASIDGLLHKLDYIAKLRSKTGKYEHWGLERTHGALATERVLADVHSELYLELLRTPLSELRDEAVEGKTASGEILHSSSQQLMPADPRGGSAAHFNSVVLALDLLAQARESSDRRGA
jgi:hypothetical protein